MPLYEYLCDACAHRFEVIQKYSDPHIEVCPKCGGAVKKLLSSPAIQFKGSGFYINDYARKSDNTTTSGSSSASESKSDSKSESKSDAKSDTKSDAKPESKSDSKPTSGS
ncbi:MAG: FmdB family zinc ribbon protein [Vicinamibacterales bacterium]